MRLSSCLITGPCGTMALLREPAGLCLAVALAVAMGPSLAVAGPWQDCTGAQCPLLENCIEEALEPGACCATCVRHGCACEGYQYYDCVQGGFVDGRVPAGQSYFVDFGSTECSCPPGGGKISCQFMLCPELPPNCIEAIVAADSCPQCGQVGCVHSGRKYPAGHTIHLSACRACHCPDTGGELICSQLPGCHGNLSDTEEGDPEWHYEDPYSYDQEVAEGEAVSALAGAAGAPAALGGGVQPPPTIQASPWSAILPRPTAAAALGPPAPVQAKARRVTEDTEEDKEEGEEGAAVTDRLAAGDLGVLDRLPTEAPARPTVAVQEEQAEAKAAPEENLIPDAQATPRSARKEGPAPLPGSGPAGVVPSRAMLSPPEGPVKPSTHPILAEPLHKEAWVLPTQEVPEHRPVLPRSRAEEDTDPNSVHSVPRSSPEGSTKDLMESCCAVGQQWAIDNDECAEMPESGAEGDVCRTAQRHCCVSYLEEKSCMAGVLGAKEGEACGPEDNNTCSGSLYKQCCDCCGLGLRVRAEGQSCESNPNLGYPCNHVMLSCCEGGDPLIVPEVRRPPEPGAALHRGEPDRTAPQPGPAQESAPRSEAAQAALNTIPLPVPQPNTCTENGPCRQVCSVLGGSAVCSCFPGYAIMADGVSCEDQDECLLGTHDCSRRQSCVNTLGSFSCASHAGLCAEGYILNAHRKCVDINECVTDLHTCSRGEHCVNTLGSFRCYKALTCGRGVGGQGADTRPLCADVDECTMGSHNCQPGFSCQNTKGSFYCQARQRCMEGFLQDPEGNCVDINECTSLPEPCRPGFSCVNTVGSYTCQRNPLVCRHGYHASEDGAQCVDVNECLPGWTWVGKGLRVSSTLPAPPTQCPRLPDPSADVNECWTSPGRLCQHTCENTLGSYRCSCASGFRLAADGKHCEDVNECETQRCSQECANIYGSYQCYCRQGYQLAEDGHTCRDIDECAQAAAMLCTFRCLNVPGSYQCACPEQGYTMMANGRSCKDLDECALGTHNCSEAETCHNLQGSFRCLRFECPPNYVRVSETKCERTACHDLGECQSSPARITYYQLNFQTGLLVPAHIFRIGPAPAFTGDTISLTITRGNEEGYFGTRRLNAYTGVVSLQRPVTKPASGHLRSKRDA
ncbi:fibulin-2 [Fukomys damarensis]|uniref:fibulin-2 n=1 Tax=Fukomys damarensis TaxID=885580 RepID=UPI00054032FB|nr:fibulin-2 [Fukomys damarensis]